MLGAALFAAALTAPAAGAYESRVVALRARHLVFDPVSGKLYASIPSIVGPSGNSVRAIDPETLAVGPAVPVGSEPNRLAVSDDGSALYVGLDGSFSIRRLSLPALAPGAEFPVGATPNLRAEEIEVQPGDANVIAVAQARQASPRYAGIGIYENGVLRPATMPGHDGPNRIEFSTDPGRLYGYGSVSTTGAGFFRIRVDEDGATLIDGRGGLLSGFGTDIEFFAPRVYSNTGAVVDPERLARAGRFASGHADGMVADPDTGHAYFVYPGAVAVFDLERFVPLDVIEVDMLGYPANLLRIGPGRLAFTTDAGQIILFDATPPDGDADGTPDHLDNCAGAANADQADADQDGIGDACDPHPGESEAELAQCGAEQEAVAEARVVCEAEPRFLDADADGRHDARDRCPATPAGIPVDESGCSLAEFCARRVESCEQADWRNDEPAAKRGDCLRLGSKREGYQCVPG
jgi:hypothetical protein